MGLVLLLALQAALSVAGFAVLWRRIDRLNAEIVELRRAQSRSPARKVRAQGGGVAVVDEVATEGPLARAAQAWGLAAKARDFDLRGPTLSPETGRGLVLAVLAVSPAAAFFFNADAPSIVASGLAIGAAMMVVALRPIWRSAAWAGVLTSSAWALLGFALTAAHADPTSYAICVALAGACGLIHAYLRRATPGATMALAMSAAVLALASQTGMVGPAGLAFGAIVATAAIIGAMSLRLEAMHLASFGAAVIGLFVLSGQDSAAIWFTPAASWAGALYFSIAAIRVPQLGPRGVALAGTGAFAPLGVIASLHSAQHGLASAYAAAGAFVVLAALIGVMIAVSAMRRSGGLEALRLTLWVLAFGAFLAVCGAIVLAAPPQIAAPLFALFGLGLVALDMRYSNAVWRVFAVAAGVLAAAFTAVTAQTLLQEASTWPAAAQIAAGVVLPALLAGATAWRAERSKADATASLFEVIAITLGVLAASLFVRLVYSDGATLLQPISFAEAGMHCAAWLAAALIIGLRAQFGATRMRVMAMNVLFFAALAVMAVSSVLWTTSFWTERAAAAPALLSRETLGFLAPGILFAAHWYFWRRRGDDTQTRLALAGGALLLAAFVTTEAFRAEGAPNWLPPLATAFAFAMALGVNFAPTVIRSRPLNLEENFHRDRRSEQSA